MGADKREAALSAQDNEQQRFILIMGRFGKLSEGKLKINQ
jgi:hypothetical protein